MKRKNTPYENADVLFQSLIFTQYIKAGIEKHEISNNIFHHPLSIAFDDASIKTFAPPNYDEHQVETMIMNLRNISLGACFIGFDEALKDAFKNKEIKDNDINSLKDIIYMLRCAFAHTPSKPTWNIAKDKYQKRFEIKEINFSMDFNNLHGKEVEITYQDGAPSLWNLMEYCLSVLKKYEWLESKSA